MRDRGRAAHPFGRVAFALTAALLLASGPARGQGAAGDEQPIKLAEGVYGIKGPGEAINTGFVVGDRGVFVYSCDLSDYDRRMRLIRSVAGGRPIRFVANGHYAGDDTGCNHLLAEQGAVVLGSAELARQLRPYWPARMADELKRGRIKKEYVEGKSVELALPVITFDDKLTVDLGSHVVELVFVGKAHTPDNTIAYLRKEKVLFVNDLLFVELHPTADDRSDIANWQRILRQLATWPVDTVVPGHGAFAPGNGVKPLLDLDRYFETLRAKVKAMKDAGRSLEEIKAGIRTELGEFGRWPRERALPATVEQMYREVSAGR
ncbi:MAG TPA: MBL fold metallo-hydrolase [Thermodesulfobacteriota bacterium]|nr:MBL fold metallo-hydrolase [Thermodesulfobacteriota bacterium]